MADHTCADLMKYVERRLPMLGASPDNDTILDLLNQGLQQLGQIVRGFPNSWSNDGETGSPTLSGVAVTFPSDLLHAKSVKWANKNLTETTEAAMDASHGDDWREDTGTPDCFIRTATGLELNCEPVGSTTGLLEIWGVGTYADLAQTETAATTPLRYVPKPNQMAPAYYAVSMVPIPIMQLTEVQLQIAQAEQQKHDGMWAEQQERFTAAIRGRRFSGFTGR